MGDQLPEAGAESPLRPWLERRQVIVGEAFQRFLVGSVRTPTSVEATMLIKKLQRNCWAVALLRWQATLYG